MFALRGAEVNLCVTAKRLEDDGIEHIHMDTELAQTIAENSLQRKTVSQMLTISMKR